MINLIQNELYKLLRIRNLLPFLLCFAAMCGYFSVFQHTHRSDAISYTDPETVRRHMQELPAGSEAVYEREKYQFLLDQKLLIPVDGWQMDALDLAFSTYGKQIADQVASPRRLAAYYRYQKLYCEAVVSNNHQSYLQLLAEQMQNHTQLSSADQYSYSLYYAYLISQNVVPGMGDWREEAAFELLDSRLTLSSLEMISENEVPNFDRLWRQAYDRQAAAEYRITHDIALSITAQNANRNPLWQALFGSSQMYVLLCLPLLFLFSGILSGEYQKHQLGLQLAAPIRRSRYWCAKAFCVFAVCIVSCTAMFLLRILLAGIFFGFSNLSAVTLFVRDGQVSSYPTLLLLLRNDIIASVPLYVLCACILFCSTLLPTPRLAFLLSCIALLLASFSYLKPALVLHNSLKYTVFGTANLLYIFEHSSLANFLRSLIIQLLHLILCLTGGVWLFRYKQL